jgi:GcrA cell cycle regulator
MWTDERVEVLQRMWMEGYSAREISDTLQGVSRNAVIGKIHRLGKRVRPAAASTVVRRAPVARTTPARQPQPQPERAEQSNGVDWTIRPRRVCVAVAEEPGLATMGALSPTMCKWPIGDPSGDNFTFCGRPSASSRPYCIHHANLAYRPPSGMGEMKRLIAKYG